MGGCAKHLQGTWTDQRQGELLREITLNTMVRINTNRSSIPELLRKCAQEGRGHVWHPNKIHSEKAWTCLKMESSATKVWFGQSKKSHVVRGNLLWFSAANFCVFFRNSFPKLCGKVTLALPPSFPLEFLHLEELLMTSYICARSDRSERACAQIC